MFISRLQTKFGDRSVTPIKFRAGMESGELDSAILSHLPTSDRMSLLRRQGDERFMVLRLAISYDGRDVPMGGIYHVRGVDCCRSGEAADFQDRLLWYPGVRDEIWRLDNAASNTETSIDQWDHNRL